ncbi:peptidase E [Patescibacteria group bacterium]|nr:peptidase E [Patescibacteria group bacterium]MCL5091320.1 peptidase E [Patescibacteria group bacterium]
METLLLTSQGLPDTLKDVFVSLLVKPAKDIKVSFITTAAYGEEANPPWLQVYRDQLRDYGISQVEDLDLRGKTAQELSRILDAKDIIFVNGGNSFYLLDWVRKSGFDRLVQPLLRAGKLYIGISAGSYIVCPTIEQSNWKHQDRNKVGLTDLTGLGLVPFLITAHYTEAYRPIIERAAPTTKYPVVALNDRQAILVKGDRYKLVGDQKRVFFNGFRENWP